MIKRGGESGSGGWNWFTGWMNVFFPYNKEKKKNPCAFVPYEETNVGSK